jgi:hypothetical protein
MKTGDYQGRPLLFNRMYMCVGVRPDLLHREYFIDGGGHLSVDARRQLLMSSGHRRCSVDLSSHRCRQVSVILAVNKHANNGNTMWCCRTWPPA